MLNTVRLHLDDRVQIIGCRLVKAELMRNKWWAKLLRIVGIVFMSLTALFTLSRALTTLTYGT
jgi:hypothetical protein